MENFNLNDPLNQPRPVNQDIDKPIPFDDSEPSKSGISHSPLDLGGTSPVQIPKVEPPKPAAAAKPATAAVAATAAGSSERITGVKTFFTKLHPGAINFLDEQITKWLTENPNVRVKRTNVVTGEIQSKKTEPNIVITIWY